MPLTQLVPSERELSALRKLAEELAHSRKETATSAHLLAAVASRPGTASDLLTDRQLTVQGLLRAARSAAEDKSDPIARALDRARNVAVRMGAQEPAALHLLLALLSEPRSAARRALEQHGVDIGRLRTTAMNVGLGLLAQRRIRDPHRQGMPDQAASPARTRARAGVTLPLFPLGPETRGRSRTGGAAEPHPPTGRARATPVATRVMAVAGRATPSGPASSKDVAGQATSVPAHESPATRRARRVGQDAKFHLDPRAFPTLCAVGHNLTAAAARGELEPVVGRGAEIEQALDVLAKRQGNNPCLVGVPGVGKTSVVYGMAQRIARAQDVISLDDRVIVEIGVSELVAGTGVRGALAQKMAGIVKELAAAKGRVVVFFDDIHQLFSSDLSEEISSDLKLALARGEFPCIGATTPEHYRRVIESDAAIARRFTPLEISELSREESFLVLDAVSKKLEAHHHVSYDESALAVTVGWTLRYLPGRVLPDKAISIADLAGARTRRRGARVVDTAAIAEVVAEAADIPLERLLETDGARLLRLEQILGDRVVGHEEALCRVARILRRDAAGLGAARPIGTFLLLGPTGVGKTETAKATAEVLFHSESAMTRIDLSEYSEPHSLARLIGAPPGYVGHEAGGALTEAVRRRPYQVILLDEVEKAHPDVLMTFLGVFDEGRLTDGRGRVADFTNTVIFMTSNIASEQATPATQRRVGFAVGEGPSRSQVEARVTAAARAALAPELYNRIDEVIVFSPLGREQVREIARRLLGRVGATLQSRHGVLLEVDEPAIDVLLDAGGFEPTLGARPMRRAIGRLVEAPLAERILGGALGRGEVARLRGRRGQIVVEIHSQGQAANP
ncbi:MAG: ATP-dependent Clp protease ATP-binding subunit [Polyangiaceae bacterium]|nr:ATP-dependent Clp protease ATP-binding subunit [Polyangiaceae bacterium]